MCQIFGANMTHELERYVNFYRGPDLSAQEQFDSLTRSISGIPKGLEPGHNVRYLTGEATGDIIKDTPRIQKELDRLDVNEKLFIKGGNWKVAELNYAKNGQNAIRGAGRNATRLTFVPSADGQSCFTADHGAPMYFFEFGDLTIYTQDTAYDKVGLKLVDGAETIATNINVIGFGGAGTDSVAVQNFGRESLWAKNWYLGANIPLRMSPNPYAEAPPGTPRPGFLSADHFTFKNMIFNSLDYTTTAALPKACILIDSTSHVSQLQFLGSQVWLLGSGHGLYYYQNPADTFFTYGSGLRVDNLRSEQSSDSSKYSIYLDMVASYGIRNISLNNCELDETRNGYYARNFWSLSVNDSLLTQATARTIANVDNFYSMAWKQVSTLEGIGNAGAVTLPGGHTLQWTPGGLATFDHPFNGIWSN